MEMAGQHATTFEISQEAGGLPSCEPSQFMLDYRLSK